MKKICAVCDAKMHELTRSKSSIYYKCSTCFFWTTTDFEGGPIYSDYTDYQIGDSEYIGDRERRVHEARQIIRKKISTAGVSTGASFLDIGCSEGFYVEAARAEGLVAAGLDVPSAKIEYCKSIGLDVRGIDEPSSWNKFDFILLRHTIEHLPFFMETLRDACGRLAEAGVICIEVPNQGGLGARWRRTRLVADRFLGHLYPPTHVNAFEEKTFRYVARALEMRPRKIMTYSQASPDWTLGQYIGPRTKKLFHNCSAQIGLGENIAAFLVKTVAAEACSSSAR